MDHPECSKLSQRERGELVVFLHSEGRLLLAEQGTQCVENRFQLSLSIGDQLELFPQQYSCLILGAECRCNASNQTV